MDYHRLHQNNRKFAKSFIESVFPINKKKHFDMEKIIYEKILSWKKEK